MKPTKFETPLRLGMIYPIIMIHSESLNSTEKLDGDGDFPSSSSFSEFLPLPPGEGWGEGTVLDSKTHLSKFES
jgi:hypothetical protein